MQLQKHVYLALFTPGFIGLGGVQSVFTHSLGHGHTIAVLIGLKLIFIELAAHGTAGKQPAAETGSFLLRKGHKLNGTLRHKSLVVESAGGLQSGYHTGCTVKAAAGLYRVKMAAGHDYRGGGVPALHTAYDGAHCVLTNTEPGGLHLGYYIVSGLGKLLGVGVAGAAYALHLGILGQSFYISLNAFNFSFQFILLLLNDLVLILT